MVIMLDVPAGSICQQKTDLETKHGKIYHDGLMCPQAGKHDSGELSETSVLFLLLGNAVLVAAWSFLKQQLKQPYSELFGPMKPAKQMLNNSI